MKGEMMNELTCNSICRLFCCPPVPSKIAAKLAFMPPPPSYEITHFEGEDGKPKCSFALSGFLNESFVHFDPDSVEVHTATTRKGNCIVLLYMHTNPATKLTFLLSHGNAVDVGLMLNFMHELGAKLRVNMMCYDYSGYGCSTGRPLEKHLYADSECAFDYLREHFGVPSDQIVLYGQSIGTVPTVHLATIHRVAAVVLHSPLMSGLRVAFPRLKRNYCCDVFSNYTRAHRILSQTLIIHGLNDEIISQTHAERLLQLIPISLQPLFIRGAGHNDCEIYEEYLIRLEYLVYVELPHPPTTVPEITYPAQTFASFRAEAQEDEDDDDDDVGEKADEAAEHSHVVVGITKASSKSFDQSDHGCPCSSLSTSRSKSIVLPITICCPNNKPSRAHESDTVDMSELSRLDQQANSAASFPSIGLQKRSSHGSYRHPRKRPGISSDHSHTHSDLLELRTVSFGASTLINHSDPCKDNACGPVMASGALTASEAVQDQLESYVSGPTLTPSSTLL